MRRTLKTVVSPGTAPGGLRPGRIADVTTPETMRAADTAVRRRRSSAGRRDREAPPLSHLQAAPVAPLKDCLRCENAPVSVDGQASKASAKTVP